MDKNRKKIIIDEIRYWKEHQLLPEKYCNFLLTLYTQGETDFDEQEHKKKEKLPYYLLWYVANTLLLLIPLLFFFTKRMILLEFLIGLLALGIAYMFHQKYKKHPNLASSYSILVLFVLFFLVTISIADEYVRNDWIIYGWTLLNSVIWIVTGILKRYLSLQIAGVFVFIIIGIVILFDII